MSSDILSSLPSFLLPLIQDHWFSLIVIGIFLTGENAILAAFVLTAQNPVAFLGIFPAATLGTLAADLFWYFVARYALSQSKLREKIDRKSSPEVSSFIFRLADQRPYLALFFIKFLVGMRLLLTLFLVLRHQFPLGRYPLFNTTGIIIFVSFLAIIGWLIGNGIGAALSIYHSLAGVIAAIILLSLLSHFLPSLLSKFFSQNKKPE